MTTPSKPTGELKYKKCEVGIKHADPQIYNVGLSPRAIVVGRIPLNYNKKQTMRLIQKQMLGDAYKIIYFRWIK